MQEYFLYIFWLPLFQRKIDIKFLLAPLKTLILKIAQLHQNFYSGIPSLSLFDFLQCTFMAGFPNTESQAAFGTTLRVTGGYQNAGTSTLKRVTGRTFPISTWFHTSKIKISKKLWKPSALIQTVQFWIFGPSKISISWHYPFNHNSVFTVTKYYWQKVPKS